MTHSRWYVGFWFALFMLCVIATLVALGTVLVVATGHADGDVAVAGVAAAVCSTGAVLSGLRFGSTATGRS